MGLTSDELLIVQLHERPRRELSIEERESMIQEMKDIRREMMIITKEKFEYQKDVNRSVSVSLSLSLSLSSQSMHYMHYMYSLLSWTSLTCFYYATSDKEGFSSADSKEY